MKDKPLSIGMADFIFRLNDGTDHIVKDVVARKVPECFMQNEEGFKRAFKAIPEEKIKKLIKKQGKYVFAVNFTKMTSGTTDNNPYI